jgi:hypothetical protein
MSPTNSVNLPGRRPIGPVLGRGCSGSRLLAPSCRSPRAYVSDLGAAPPGAGRILRFANPISGKVITTVEVRKPASLKDHDSDDEDGHH